MGLNPLIKQSAQWTSALRARNAGWSCDKLILWENLASPEKYLEISGVQPCFFPAILTPINDNWGDCLTFASTDLCIRRYRRSDTVSLWSDSTKTPLSTALSQTFCKTGAGWGMYDQRMVPADQSALKSWWSSEEGSASLLSLQVTVIKPSGMLKDP